MLAYLYVEHQQIGGYEKGVSEHMVVSAAEVHSVLVW